MTPPLAYDSETALRPMLTALVWLMGLCALLCLGGIGYLLMVLDLA